MSVFSFPHLDMLEKVLKIVISILFVEKSDENTFQSRTKHFSGLEGLRFEVRA